MPRPALLFDIGNVLVTFDFSCCSRALAADTTLSEAHILSAIEPIKVEMESGHCSSESFITRSMEAISYTGSRQQFQQAWCEIFALNAPMARTLATAAGKVPAYLFSNTNGLHKDYLLSQFPIFQHFSGGIYSHEALTMKPAPGMYEQAIARYELDPAQTFYVDDLIANIHTGDALGFHTFHYDPQDHAPLDRALHEWLASYSLTK